MVSKILYNLKKENIMINGAQVHLALNHMPVVGVLIGFLILLVGMLFKNRMIKRTALAVIVFAAITIAPAYLSGEPAEEMVEHKPGVTKALIHDHEEFAELSLVFTAITGGIAALGLVLAKLKKDNLESKSTLLVLLLSAVNFGLLANTAHLGGLIRHDELRSDVVALPSGEGTNDHDDDD